MGKVVIEKGFVVLKKGESFKEFVLDVGASSVVVFLSQTPEKAIDSFESSLDGEKAGSIYYAEINISYHKVKPEVGDE